MHAKDISEIYGLSQMLSTAYRLPSEAYGAVIV